MWELEIWNPTTQETKIIFGYSMSDAMKRNPELNPEEWECILSIYID